MLWWWLVRFVCVGVCLFLTPCLFGGLFVDLFWFTCGWLVGCLGFMLRFGGLDFVFASCYIGVVLVVLICDAGICSSSLDLDCFPFDYFCCLIWLVLLVWRLLLFVRVIVCCFAYGYCL